MNAAATPSMGTARGSSVRSTRRTATLRTTIVTAHIASDTGTDRNPSGACISGGWPVTAWPAAAAIADITPPSMGWR